MTNKKVYALLNIIQVKMRKKSSLKAFTLIELLVVIAVLGVLAAVLLFAINPLQQMARGRDSGRKNNVGQIVNAMQSYYTSRNAVYPTVNATWILALVDSGELKQVIPVITYSAGGTVSCGGGGAGGTVQNNYCYRTGVVSGNTEAIVYTRMESTAEDSKCPSPTTQDAFFLWSSADARSGVVCVSSGTEPTSVSPGAYTYL